MATRKKILVIRFSSIGDIVLTTPVVRCLRTQLDAEIHYLVKASYKAALKGNPYVDHIITIEENVAEVLDELKTQEYDWIADLHHNIRSLQVKRALQKPGASFPKLNVEKWFMTTFKFNRLPDSHIVDRYFEAVKPLGVVNDGQGLDFNITDEDVIDVEKISEGKVLRGKYLVLAIGAGLATKNLEDTQWLSLINAVTSPVILLGGPDDVQRGKWLEDQSVKCINLAGSLSLGQSASVIAQSAGVISPDTGLMHIAAALGKPVASVWGNTIPEFGMTTYYPSDLHVLSKNFEIKDLPCRPCSKIGYAKCPKGHFRCMRSQPLSEIATFADRFI